MDWPINSHCLATITHYVYFFHCWFCHSVFNWKKFYKLFVGVHCIQLLLYKMQKLTWKWNLSGHCAVGGSGVRTPWAGSTTWTTSAAPPPGKDPRPSQCATTRSGKASAANCRGPCSSSTRGSSTGWVTPLTQSRPTLLTWIGLLLVSQPLFKFCASLDVSTQKAAVVSQYVLIYFSLWREMFLLGSRNQWTRGGIHGLDT